MWGFFDSHSELSNLVKRQRVYNFFLTIPHLERFLFLCYLACFDSFLYHLTVLPLRIIYAFYRSIVSLKFTIEDQFRGDLIKGILIGLVAFITSLFDSSRLYHVIRGQSTLKLYVIFNVFEVADKLLGSFGSDVMDAYLDGKFIVKQSDTFSPFLHFVVALGYVLCHATVLFYQLITLNVTVNSFSNALITLLVSNQFVELKSAVFKKFESENLLQLVCADGLERFQLSFYIFLIGTNANNHF
jgi:hypothetical protein